MVACGKSNESDFWILGWFFTAANMQNHLSEVIGKVTLCICLEPLGMEDVEDPMRSLCCLVRTALSWKLSENPESPGKSVMAHHRTMKLASRSDPDDTYYFYYPHKMQTPCCIPLNPGRLETSIAPIQASHRS